MQRLMTERGLKQGDILAALGVKQGTLSDWIRDRRGLPEAPTLLRFAKVFHVTIDDLLRGVDPDYDVIVDAARLTLAEARDEAMTIAAAWPGLPAALREDLRRLILRHSHSAAENSAAEKGEPPSGTRHPDQHQEVTGTSRRRRRTGP